MSEPTQPRVSITTLPIGYIVQFLGELPPGCLPCDGREVSRAEYPELFAVIGAVYGSVSERVATFNLPDFRSGFADQLGQAKYAVKAKEVAE